MTEPSAAGSAGRRLARRPVVWVVAVVVATVALGAGATARQAPPPAPAAAVTTPVVDTTVACPGLRSRAGYTDSTVAAATPPQAPSPEAGPDSGSPAPSRTATATQPAAVDRAVVRTLTKAASSSKALITLTTPGERGWYTGRDGERDSVVGHGTGALAPGFSVTQTERTVDGGGRGLASTQCLPTGADFWFVGASSGVGQRATLVLTNPEDATASVDVDVYGRSGPLDAPAARGVQVAPRSSTELRLDTIVPGQRVLALHVKVTGGRLSAAVTETDVAGLEPRGTDWIPGTLPPASTVLVAGFPAQAQGRVSEDRLDIAVPGETDAVVSVELVTPDGTFTPTGNDVLDVRAGTVRSFDLTKVLGGQPATVRLTSDQPIVVGARVLLRRPRAFGDTLFLAAADPLSSAAVVPDNRTTGDLSTRLVLTAPAGRAAVTLSAFDANTTTDRNLTIPAGSTREVTVTDPTAGGGFGLTVTPAPGSGPVVGVRLLDEEGSRGPLVTALPLLSARITALVRSAVPSIDAGMDGHSS